MKVLSKLQICKDFAVDERKGLCLATEYKNSKTKMLWQCEKGHQWEAIWSHVKNNHWCPECSGSRKYTIKEVEEFIESINYKLISTEYKNNLTPLKVECDQGHIFYPTLNNLKSQKSKCEICARISNGLKHNLGLEEVIEFLKSIKYELISTDYKDVHTPLKVKCDKGHISYPTFGSLKYQNSRCNTCGYIKSSIKNRIDFEEVKKFVENINYKLISIEFKNIHTPLKVMCDKGHISYPTLHSLKYGGRCIECSSFKTEKLCKQLLEEKLNIKFTKTRFYYDLNNSKKFIEYDGYNEEYKIAFEYHGYQHYEFPNHYHKTKEFFLNQIKRDDMKEEYAVENNIELIIIPYTESNNLELFICKAIEELPYFRELILGEL